MSPVKIEITKAASDTDVEPPSHKPKKEEKNEGKGARFIWLAFIFFVY